MEIEKKLTTYNIGYSTPDDDFSETQFDAEDLIDLLNLFIIFASENNFLNSKLTIDYIEKEEI